MIAEQLRLRAAPVLAAGAAFAASTALWFFDPTTHRVPLCPLHAMTGLWCPFCGCTRASRALIHAQPATALHDNALFVAALPLLALFWWRWLRPPDSRLAARPLPRPVFWAGIALVLAFGVVRNLAMGRWLAPPS
ncbi:MAG: hypothetical protein QOI26_897 [Pseudonocardiales bacterium]|nr:hypothetical protein [Pseudonocardiales bacterium]